MDFTWTIRENFRRFRQLLESENGKAKLRTQEPVGQASSRDTPEGADGFASPSGPAQRAVTIVVGAVAVLALVLLPIAGHPGLAMPGIVALFATALLITELATSFLLLVRFRAIRTWSLLILSSAYFYSGLMTIPHLLTFPGAVLGGQPLIKEPWQTASWIYILWVSGFALLSLIAVCLEGWFSDWRIAAENVGLAGFLAFCLATGAVLAVVFTAFAAGYQIFLIGPGLHFSDLNLATTWLAVALLAVSIAIILLAIGEKNRLFLWLSLALTPMAFANVVSTAGGGRFTVGWMIGRLSWLIAACVLFIYLLVLHGRDQRLFARARELLLTGADDKAVAAWDKGGERIVDVALETFVARENVARFKRMLEEEQDWAKRRVLLRMLDEEEGRLKQLEKPTP